DSTYDANGVGDGKWHLFDYWTVNHYTQSGLASPKLAGQAVTTPWGTGNAGTTTNIASRYQAYLYELANPAYNADVSYGLHKPPHTPQGVPGETGAPQCSSQPLPKVNGTEIDGRVITVAVANCNANPIGSGKTTFTPAFYAQFFLTRPVCNPCQDA